MGGATLTTHRHRTAPRLLALSLNLCLLGVAGQAFADDHDRGFYVGFEAVLADAATLESLLTAVNHPTRCDVLLYTDPGLAPTSDAACRDNTSRPLFDNRFDLGSKLAAGVSIGYDLGKLRLELEHVSRHQGGRTVPLRTASGNVAIAGKGNEWSPVDPPTESVSDFSSREFFVNVYWDFENDSSWTPYLGIGGGLARTSLRYEVRLLRKTLAQGYQEVAPPLTLEDRPAAAAGSLSLFDDELQDDVFGYQILAGLDHAIGDKTSFTIKARWTRFADLTGSAVWTLIRSHVPVQADGTTPFGSDLEFDGIGSVGVSAGLRYHF